MAPPAVAAELPGPPPELAPELTPESDPLSRPLLDSDPFGIRASLTATKTTPSGAPEPEDIPVVFKPTPQPEPSPEPSPTPAPEPTLPQPAATNSVDDKPISDDDFVAPEGWVAAPLPQDPPADQVVSGGQSPRDRKVLAAWGCALVVGMVLLGAAALHVGPDWLDGVGAIAVLTTYAWAVTARTGGRQVLFSILALVIGVVAVLVDGPVLRSGAAVLTCVVSGVLAVVITVPARNFIAAAREVVVATAVASVGAFATVGFAPSASTTRFEYVTLAVGFAVLFSLVWRFAAGLHGLGTRGLAIVVVGTVVLVGSLVYTELLRHFEVSTMFSTGSDFSEWLRGTIGAVPRPITFLLGVPALVWGVHMRARRRQGWWVCTFGAAATLPVAQRLVNLDTSYVEAGLQTTYSVAIGLLVGYAVIRLDLRFTGQRGARARAAEEAHAVRPEPPRFAPL